eukprot:TRINITY_DN51197_c0_g1_i1.p1 TRINITY_DN51197_c0_g1~~TRINITY_DN51197_c0_g1_i1.p1  ORF type:complete len:262 (+),score=44.14 TRINITY_DN51197_c0_g1_i1:142-927(+)
MAANFGGMAANFGFKEAGKKAAAQVAAKQVKAELEGGVFTFIPRQIGPPTEYATNIRHWMHFILLLQVSALLLRAVILLDLLGAFWMGIVCALGWYAWGQSMNISYVTMWGFACGLNAVFDVFGFLIPTIFGLLKLEIMGTLVRITAPLSELLGAAFAWHVYRDYMHSRGVDLPGADPLAPLFEQEDPEIALQKARIAGTAAAKDAYAHAGDYGAVAKGELQRLGHEVSDIASHPGAHNPFQTQPQRGFHGTARPQHPVCC